MRTLNLVLLLFAVSCTQTPKVTKYTKESDHLKLAREILAKTPLIDGHNDLPWTIRNKGKGDIKSMNLLKKSPTDTDLPRLKQGGVGGQFWSVFIPVGEEHAKKGYAKTQLEQIEIARRMIEMYPKHLEFVTTAAGAKKAINSGRIASFLGMEGGHAIENSIGALRAFYRLGVRYMTLTHSKNNDWADSATDIPKLNGMSKLGFDIVSEMNRLGMIVDLSHVSVKVMHQVLNKTKAPVIFSHSSARAICSHKRNVPDDVLKRLKKNGGVIMITFVTGFISQKVADWWKTDEKGPRPDAYLKEVADHLNHVKKVAGINHIGIGGDYYDQEHVVKGLEDVSKYPYLFAELLKRGWTRSELEKLANKNIMRVIKSVEAASSK